MDDDDDGTGETTARFVSVCGLCVRWPDSSYHPALSNSTPAKRNGGKQKARAVSKRDRRLWRTWKMENALGGPPPYGMDDSDGESITENGATETIHRRCVFGASKHDIRYTRCTVCSQQSVYECAGTYTQIHMHGNGYIFVFCGGSHTQSERDGACATEEPRVFLVDGANRMRRGQSRRRRSTGGKIERILC